MVDTKRLIDAIEKSGLKKQYLAQQLDLSIVTFWRKVNGVSEFKLAEVTKLCDSLNLHNGKERDLIFFAKTVNPK